MKTSKLTGLFFAITLISATSIPFAATAPPLPARIIIKTPTQTFNRYYYFAIHEGRIWHKPNTETTGKTEPWTLFLKTGLPHNRDVKNYPAPRSVQAIHADADEIVALSDTGRFYWLRLEKGASWDGRVWNHTWGWPDMEPLHLDGPAANARAWAIGRRNRDVLWHEDIDGNPHHYGTMGITTLYALNADGTEIRFTDSGLPADFSHTLTLPERGRFIAEALSASASTLFVIDAAGRMFTRLVDFDTIGSDPMFFKYSYRREKRNDRGSDWDSNFTNWSLPAESWHEQPAIPLNSRAAITREITILQNGHGNAARELRVAGRDASGRAGYWHKQIPEPVWQFTPDDRNIATASFLKPGATPPQRADNGDISYTGRMHNGTDYLPGISIELLDFNLAESPALLRITEGSVQFDAILHTVEAWTYLKRNDPGRDGTAKVFLGTIDLPRAVTPVMQKSRAHRLLRRHRLKTFRFILEATTEHVHLQLRSRRYGTLRMALAAHDAPLQNTLAIRSYALARNGFDAIAADESLRIPPLETTGAGDIPLLKKKIEANREAIARMNRMITEMKDDARRIKRSSAAYSAFYALTHLTGLFLVDRPKIWTATRHFGALMKGNRDSTAYLYFAGKRSHEQAIGRIHSRVTACTNRIDALEGRSSHPYFFSEHVTDYFTRLNIREGTLTVSLPVAATGQCTITPEEENGGSFMIALGTEENEECVLLRITLPALEKEINRCAPDSPVAAGRYSARIQLTESDDSADAHRLYRALFAEHRKIKNDADEFNGVLTVTDSGWTLSDTSGLPGNQLQVSFKR